VRPPLVAPPGAVGRAPLRPVAVCPLPQNLAALEWSPDGTALAWADMDGGVGVLRGGAIKRWESPSALCLAWAPDNRRFLTGGEDGKIRTWDVASGKTAEWESVGRAWVAGAVWGPTCIATAEGKDVVLRSFDGAIIGEPTRMPGTVSAILRDPARDGFIAVSYGLAIAIPAGAGAVRRFEWKGSMLAAAASPDGRYVAIGCQDASAMIWQRSLADGPANEAEPLRMGGFPGKVLHVAWGDAGSLLTAGGDALAAWSFAGRGPAGESGIALEGHLGRILAVQTARRGRVMVSLGEEGRSARVICWAFRRGWEPIASGSMPVNTLALRADGKGFAAAGEQLVLAEIPD